MFKLIISVIIAMGSFLSCLLMPSEMSYVAVQGMLAFTSILCIIALGVTIRDGSRHHLTFTTALLAGSITFACMSGAIIADEGLDALLVAVFSMIMSSACILQIIISGKGTSAK